MTALVKAIHSVHRVHSTDDEHQSGSARISRLPSQAVTDHVAAARAESLAYYGQSLTHTVAPPTHYSTGECPLGKPSTPTRVKPMAVSAHPLFGIWAGMIRRCHNPRDAHYYLYGQRGIAVCAEWRESFERFVMDVGPRPEGRSLDRVNNDGNYEPGNTRWATPKEQIHNRRPRSEWRNSA